MKKVAFFNNKGGVGKTTLVYHLAHMLVEKGHRVLLLDLDPQSNLTAMCLSEDRLEELWPISPDHPDTILGCISPIRRGLGDIAHPHLESVPSGGGGLALVPGDLGLSTFEDKLSDAWHRSMDRDEAAFCTLSAFHRVAELAALEHAADVVFFDVGPNLGAINRAALLAADGVVTPLAPDLFSMQGLRNLGPTLIGWRAGWKERLAKSPDPELPLPPGDMQPLGYVLMQAATRLNRPMRSYGRWIERIAGEYHRSVLSDHETPPATANDPFCLGIMKNYQSLMPLAQDARKPIFQLRPADGAIGAQMAAVRHCRSDFDQLADSILLRLD
jgi:cellulose biosynthesis protein BcsQ